MPTRSMSRELAKCDADLMRARDRLHSATDPDDWSTCRDEIDDLLDLRLTHNSGTARGGRHA